MKTAGRKKSKPTREAAPSPAVRDWSRAIMLAFWIVALGWTWSHLDEGWIPHDEGTLAQPAARVLMGELPHRDFDEVYTGGLDWLNAGAFQIFGTSLRSMRIALFLVFAAWVPVVFWIATRFVAPLLALPFAALAVIWSLARYPAPMPSWYVLFLATFGTAWVFKWLENGRRRWLVLGGVLGGLAVLAKVTGLHYVAAVGLFLAWREPEVSERRAGRRSADAQAQATGLVASRLDTDRAPGRIYPVALTVALAAFVALLVRQVWPLALRFGFTGQIEHFVFPEACLAAIVAARAWRGSRAPDAVRFRVLFGLVWPFAAGVLAPVAIFVIPYALRGGLGSLIEGVLILPARRLEILTTGSYPPPLWSVLFTLPLVLIACIPRPRGRRWPLIALVAGALGLLAAIWASVESEDALQGVMASTRHILPIVAVLAVWRFWRIEPDDAAPRTGRAFMLLAAAVMASLVQFPFAAHVYFFYSAPLLVLATVAVVSSIAPLRERPGLFVVAAFLIVSILVVPLSAGGRTDRGMTARMKTDRSGLRMLPSEAAEYDRVLELVMEHGRGGWLWAGQDAPELAFLADLRNATRTIFDCFDRDFSDPVGRSARLVRDLEEHGVTVVALQRYPLFSGPPPRELVDAVTSRYRKFEIVGRYVVAWKE